MPGRTKTKDDLDSPWKEALDHFLAPFLTLCFPQVHEDIAWERGYKALDKEFQQITRGSEIGKRLADKLFQVYLRDGEECWLLIHIEVQGGYDKDFAQRMFVYNYRAFDLYNRPVVSLAVLCDEQPGWRPHLFEYGRWGCTTGIRFLVAKLLDYAPQAKALEQSSNPFAAVVLAQLKVIETNRDPAARKLWKLRLAKRLFERKWSIEEVRKLFHVLSWMLVLPPELEKEFLEEMYRYEEEKHMPYLSSFEQTAHEKGRTEGLREGLLEGIELDLATKFGRKATKLLSKIREITDVETLRDLTRRIKTAKSVEEISKRIE
jgi:hypothetical protein